MRCHTFWHIVVYKESGCIKYLCFFFQAEDGIRDLVRSRGLGDVYKRQGLVKLLISPIAKFIGDYLFRGGFLDGYHGFVIARISAHATFLKYAKLKQLWREKA